MKSSVALSFSPITEESLKKILSGINAEEEKLFAREVLESFLFLSKEVGCEVAVTRLGSFLLARIYDEGKYLFPFPISLFDFTEDECKEALLALSRYTVREMIPFYITDVERESLDMLLSLFPHVDAKAHEEDEDLFSVQIMNEILLLDEVPTVSDGALSLAELGENDAENYYMLSSDESVNRYWGYSFRDDFENASAMDLYGVVRSEFDLGVAISFGVYLSGEFIGEAVVYGLDYLGGGEIAIRLIPSRQRRGIGSRTLSLLISACRKIGLKRLYARVMKANAPSVSMTSKFMHKDGEDGDAVLFSLKL